MNPEVRKAFSWKVPAAFHLVNAGGPGILRQRSAAQGFFKIAAGLGSGILTGLLVNWRLACRVVLSYFVIGWAETHGH